MSRVALNPELGGVRDAASAIISHEQTQSNRVCCFQTLDAIFAKDRICDFSFTSETLDGFCLSLMCQIPFLFYFYFPRILAISLSCPLSVPLSLSLSLSLSHIKSEVGRYQ